MIFSAFPAVDYDGTPTSDIFRNYRQYVLAAAKDIILRDYLIEGMDRPELISWKLYDDSQYYWLLLMLNSNYDPFHGWIKSQDAVHKSANYKYENAGGVNQIAYHVDEKGKRHYNLYEDPNNPRMWYDKIDKQRQHLQYKGVLVPVTIIEDELAKNEDKRVIKIISPGDLSTFMTNFKRIIGNVK
ncbi:baseplate wedge subunit [Cronobacter phage S13]|jgi:hypothetical protein|uniref:Baseplate wedge subunit n=1 Tax=Cronobacter phage LPCS28 TaxID=2924885 RepID=A0AAE9G7M6_9CAUD|nr:baseplate wedge subunit [Cronobacter phage S13]YP_010665742.1 baseplate wedge subunit [Cronobacter phage LPCS28]AIA64958.1 putative baseplate wedge subunit [Cronobacter phage S13]UNY46931.1 hypothetical protein EHEKIMEA_00024 [Cronobacter phage LPCS28]